MTISEALKFAEQYQEGQSAKYMEIKRLIWQLTEDEQEMIELLRERNEGELI